ncbi:hypothetical protein Hanom_Chr01g00056071 [Helianthus anomalus]
MKINRRNVYRSWDKETRKEIKKRVESCCEYSCYLVVWRYGNRHHSIICEVEKREKVDKKEPKEFSRCPFERHHGIHYERVICCLN